MRVRNAPIYSRNKLQIEVSDIINRSPDTVFRFWRELPNLQLVMYHLKSVRPLNANRSEWIVKIPGGIGDLKWEAEIIREEPGKYLEWNSLPGSTIEHRGYLKLSEEKKNRTRLDLSISYYTLMNITGSKITSLLNKVVEEIILNEIQALKYYLESSTEQITSYENAKQIKIDPRKG
jgi:uncharacterized membrane protein